ncbi:MAG TPA: diguanylate cyclase [Solirubrobacteraceae bacterium]|nr:diguanylate cyclase [Solirubrobacteraceae bacterium]
MRRWVGLGVAVWLTLWQARAVLAPDLEAGPLFSRFAHDVVLLVATALCLWAGVSSPIRRERRAWLLIGIGVAAWTFGELYYTAVLWTAEEIPIPSPADIGYLLFPPFMLLGTVTLLRSRTRDVPGTLWADGITAALAVSAASAAIVFETVLDGVSGQALEVALGLAYPLSDLILLGVIVGALAGTGWQLDRTWVLLFAGVGAFWLADSLYLVGNADGTYAPGAWFDVGWWLGLLLIGGAAWQPARETSVAGADERVRRIVLPLTFGSAGLALLVYGCVAQLNAVAVALAAASLLAVMARTMLTFRDNVAMLRASRAEAQTDALTGLGNRRKLARVLERELPRATRAEPLVLVLFDLDGFKHYNDTFGHPAGDTLLARLGGSLAAFLSGRGAAFRMGGDEFCALLEPGSQAPEPLIVGAAAALSERGEGFQIGCSYGAIELPLEAADVAEALRIADQRMYAQKNAGRASASRQSKDVLLRALAERNPQLRSHLGGVADLAEATALHLQLSHDEVEQVRHATELHDVGKVAVPDAILTKHGPLDEEEWAFIRRHTLIGERIIAAAPALTRVAALVRHSHERWDGTGYPDGLAGADIPIGARIVAVADAFDAMTSPRPYSLPRTPDAALDELVLCAGTQFDPAVVEAFTVAWRDQSLAAAA